MIPFVPGRAQDAAPSIRGFKYQVQLTLLRWLDLEDGEVLYLECGEDVDCVLRAPDASGVQRELEQIKARGRSITLRTPEVLCALANFAVHLKVNPRAALRFRFTTTASVGREKLSPLGKGRKAIEQWMSLQGAKIWTTEHDAALMGLALLLRHVAKPEKCPQQAWQVLLDTVHGVGPIPFATFVMRFEWSCGSVQPEDLDLMLTNRLGGLPGDTGSGDSSREQRYNQLVSHLLNQLTRSGEKSLTKANLIAALAKPTLTEHDRARVKLLEEQAASHAAMLSTLQGTLQSIGLPNAMPFLFGSAAAEFKSLTISAVLSEPPPLVAALSRRTETVSGMCKELNGPRVVWLHGDYGMGKSHLGFLMAEQCGGVVLGVSMRGLTPHQAEQGIIALLSESHTLNAIRSTNPGVVLLDDLPECEAQSRLESLVAAMLRASLSKGRVVILSSRRSPSTTMTAMLGDRMMPSAVPSFTTSDAKELFSAHGVTGPLLEDTRVAKMNAMCGGHPMLLTALARHMLIRPSEPDKALVEALLASKHRTEIDLATARAVVGTVESEACRNLLYRLASAGTGLTDDEIRSIAALKPVLPEPTACIARLDGLWLRRTTKSRYEVSPLASVLWREIPENVHKAVHRKTARLVIARRTLTASEFVRAITSMLIAEEYQTAAAHLVYACSLWPNKTAGYGDLGVLLFFPPDRDHGLHPATELALRGAQLVTAAIEGHECQPYIERIEAGLRTPTSESAVGGLLAGSMILTTSLSIPMRVAAFGARLIEQYRFSPLIPKLMPQAIPSQPENVHLLLPTACIRIWDDLDVYVGLLASLTPDRRREVVSSPELRHGMQTTVWRPLFDDKLKVTEDAFDRLGKVEARSRDLNMPVVGAYAVAGRLVVLGEHRRDVAGMLEEARAARVHYDSDAVALSIIEAIVGQQLYLNKRYRDALKHLAMGLADTSHILGIERGTRLVDAIAAAWNLPTEPVPYVEELVALLGSEEFALPEVQCQMNAQVAIVRWRQGRREDAFRHFEKSIVHFFELADATRSRQFGAALAHSINYCLAITTTGKPPPMAADGGPYVEPDPQWFLGTRDGMAGMWRVRNGPAMLKWTLGRLAESLGLEAAYTTWTDRALETAQESNDAVLLTMLAPRGIATAFRRSAWEDAVDAAITSGRAKVFIDDKHQEGASIIDDSVSFDPTLIPATPERRRAAEEWALVLLSGAIVAELGPEMLSPDHGSAPANALADVLERVGALLQLTLAWQTLAHYLRLAGTTLVTDEQHRQALSDQTDPAMQSARFVAHGLLSLREDAQLGQAVVSHTGVLYKLDKMTAGLDVPIQSYASAISRYWRSAVVRAAFRFTSPREVSRVMEKAQDLPPLRGAKDVLRAVSSALSARILPEHREWFGEEEAT